MAPDLQHATPERGAPVGVPASARVKIVACVGGVSVERGVPREEISDHLREADNVLWVDVQDPGPAELAMLVEEFGFHPLTLEGAGEGQRRPKLDEYKGYSALVTYAAAAAAAGGSSEAHTSEVDLFIGRNYFVSLHRGRIAAVEEAAARWTRGGALLREGVGYLVYVVLDSLMDSFGPLISGAEDEIGAIEDGIFKHSDEECVRELLRSKRRVAGLRRVLLPLREIFPSLLRRDHPYFRPVTQVYLADAKDHLLRILDVLDVELDMVAGALDASLAVSSQRVNRTMKTLALLTGAVAVIGTVFGAYGMNFRALPLTQYRWGFWLVSAGTIALVAVLALAGRWRKWW